MIHLISRYTCDCLTLSGKGSRLRPICNSALCFRLGLTSVPSGFSVFLTQQPATGNNLYIGCCCRIRCSVSGTKPPGLIVRHHVRVAFWRRCTGLCAGAYSGLRTPQISCLFQPQFSLLLLCSKLQQNSASPSSSCNRLINTMAQKLYEPPTPICVPGLLHCGSHLAAH